MKTTNTTTAITLWMLLEANDNGELVNWNSPTSEYCEWFNHDTIMIFTKIINPHSDNIVNSWIPEKCLSIAEEDLKEFKK